MYEYPLEQYSHTGFSTWLITEQVKHLYVIHVLVLRTILQYGVCTKYNNLLEFKLQLSTIFEKQCSIYGPCLRVCPT